MPVQQRRERQRAERHRLILDTAREIAEAEGWDAVTTRRLADAIEYSQPVLYSHFAGKEEIVAAVALDGFGELAGSLRAGLDTGGRLAEPEPDTGGGGDRLTAVARGYLEFAAAHPAVYAAMFTVDSALKFASTESPEPLREAFGLLRDALGAATGPADLDTRTELFWSTLHGLATLTAGHRLRPEHAEERLTLLVAQQG
jgi:AcrR family transcriptional regulator